MAKIVIRGESYTLRMGLWASEQIEEKYGDLRTALEGFRKERKISMVKEMFAILANAGRKYEKKPMDVTPDVLDDCTLGDLDEVAKVMNQALNETMHAETVGGNEADDEPQDALAAEYEEKNAAAGGQ